MSKDAPCNRCGKCCILLKDGIPTGKKCKWLIILPSNKTVCRKYNNRLGCDIGMGNHCGYRIDQGINITGCLNNREGLPEYDINIKTGEVRKK